MKKLIIFAICLILLTGCGQKIEPVAQNTTNTLIPTKQIEESQPTIQPTSEIEQIKPEIETDYKKSVEYADFFYCKNKVVQPIDKIDYTIEDLNKVILSAYTNDYIVDTYESYDDLNLTFKHRIAINNNALFNCQLLRSPQLITWKIDDKIYFYTGDFSLSMDDVKIIRQNTWYWSKYNNVEQDYNSVVSDLIITIPDDAKIELKSINDQPYLMTTWSTDNQIQKEYYFGLCDDTLVLYCIKNIDNSVDYSYNLYNFYSFETNEIPEDVLNAQYGDYESFLIHLE